MSQELRKKVRINTLYEIVDDLDYYQLLKQKTDCKQSSIAPAFQQQSKELHPDNAPSELKDKAAERLLVITVNPFLLRRA